MNKGLIISLAAAMCILFSSCTKIESVSDSQSNSVSEQSTASSEIEESTVSADTEKSSDSSEAEISTEQSTASSKAVISVVQSTASSKPQQSITTSKISNVIKETTQAKPVIEVFQGKDRVFAWSAYWDLTTAEKEVQELVGKADALSYFAAYFDSENKLMLPPEIEAFHRKTSQSGYINTSYLTIVNDKIKKDGTSSLKDKDLVYQLLSDKDTMNSHISAIISMATSNGYNGIEIDYENFRSDLAIWKLFLPFCDQLYKDAQKAGLKMRVILDPQTPFDKLQFSRGPEYVMMCYNLYGSHSGAGPKANKEFINGLITKMNPLPGNKSFAFATGGFDWGTDGKTSQLTEAAAQSLLTKTAAAAQRDADSGCQVFAYTDEKNIKHDVWFADSTTLNGWIDVVQSRGDYGISIWRIGGNDSFSSLNCK